MIPFIADEKCITKTGDTVRDVQFSVEGSEPLLVDVMSQKNDYEESLTGGPCIVGCVSSGDAWLTRDRYWEVIHVTYIGYDKEEHGLESFGQSNCLGGSPSSAAEGQLACNAHDRIN